MHDVETPVNGWWVVMMMGGLVWPRAMKREGGQARNKAKKAEQE